MSDQPAKQSPDETEDIEVLKVRLVGDSLESEISAFFPEAETWGILFANLARDVAQTLQEHEGADPALTLKQIREAFVAEMEAKS